MKKVLAMLLSAVLLSLSLCAMAEIKIIGLFEVEDEPDNVAVQERFQLTEEELAEITQFTVFMPQTTANGHMEHDQLSTPIGRAIAKISGSSTYQYYIMGEKDQAMQLRMAADDWDVDAISGLSPTEPWVQTLVEEEVAVPITTYFYDEVNYPNMYAIPQEVKDYFTYADGEIYMVPNSWYNVDDPETGNYWRYAGWYVNKDILEAVDMTTDDLVTIEDIETFLRKVRDAELTNADGLPVIPLSGAQDFSSARVLAATWGVSTAEYGYDFYDGELVNYRQHENFKEAVRWLAKMEDEGLVDPELFSHTNDILGQKMMAGRVALVPDLSAYFWSIMTVGHNYASDTYIPIAAPVIGGVEKRGIERTYATLGSSGIMLTKNCKNPDEIMKALDYWQNTEHPALKLLFLYGPRGLRMDFDDENPEVFWILDNEWSESSGWAWWAEVGGWSQNIRTYALPYFFNPNQTEISLTNEDGKTNIFWVQEMHVFNKVNEMDCAQRDLDMVTMPNDGAYLRYKETIDKVDLQYLTATVTADDFDAAWETYQRELESQGHISEVNADYAAAYEALMAKKGE